MEVEEGNSASTFNLSQKRMSPELLIAVAVYLLNMGLGYSELMFTDKCKGRTQ